METQTKDGKVLADQKALYDMKLHETKGFDIGANKNIMVTRVPGGWLYVIEGGYGITTTFIPFVPNKEF